MTEDRKNLLMKINELIDKRKIELLQKVPYIHEIEDGILIRFFTDWVECEYDKSIKYKKFINENDSNDVTIFHFIPKGSVLKKIPRDYISTIICINGKLELNIDNEIIIINNSTKLNINKKIFHGHAIEDTYILTINK